LKKQVKGRIGFLEKKEVALSLPVREERAGGKWERPIL